VQGILKKYNLLLAPLLALGNMGIASGANSSLQNNIEEYNILSMSIRGSETAYRFLCIHGYEYEPISIQLK